MKGSEIYAFIEAAEEITSTLENGGEMERYLRGIKRAVREGDYDMLVEQLINLKGSEVQFAMSPLMKFCGI